MVVLNRSNGHYILLLFCFSFLPTICLDYRIVLTLVAVAMSSLLILVVDVLSAAARARPRHDQPLRKRWDYWRPNVHWHGVTDGHYSTSHKTRTKLGNVRSVVTKRVQVNRDVPTEWGVDFLELARKRVQKARQGIAKLDVLGRDVSWGETQLDKWRKKAATFFDQHHMPLYYPI